MNFFEVQNKIQSSSAIKMLKTLNAPLSISFLYNRFKVAGKVAVSFSDLAESLADYIGDLEDDGVKGYSEQSATVYLKNWIEDGFLKNSFDEEKDVFVVELTPDTEKVFQWLEDISQQEFIGTESRFLLIFEILKEIVYESIDNPQEKLKELEQQKKRIEREIEVIEEKGISRKFNDTQIKERYFFSKKQAKELLSDFRQVEYNLKGITNNIQKKYLVENFNKGEIVDYLLSSDDELKESDQGKSFFAFWNFLRSPAQQTELQDLINKIYNIPEISELVEDDRFLKKIKQFLLTSGEKVQKSTRKMSEHLRKILDEQNMAENRRVLELTNEIKKWALENVDSYPIEKDFISIEGNPDINLSINRPFWKPENRPSVNLLNPEVDNEEVDDKTLMELLSHSQVDMNELKANIQRMLRYEKQVSLKDVLNKFPVNNGLEEIVCYIQLADEEPKHIVNNSVRETVRFGKEINGIIKDIKVRIPQIIFRV